MKRTWGYMFNMMIMKNELMDDYCSWSVSYTHLDVYKRQVHIMNVMDIQAVNVSETANMPMDKAGPSVLKNTLIGGVLGVFLMIAIVLVRFLMDDTVKTPEDVEKYLQLSTLAVIPLNEGETDAKKKKKKVKRS